MIAALTQDPGFVIESQTFKIMRLEKDLKQKDIRILTLSEENLDLTRKVKALQSELTLIKNPLTVKKGKSKNLPMYWKTPKAKRRYVPQPIDQDVILEVVTREFDTTIKDLEAKGRKKDISIKRQWACYMLYIHTTLTFKEIGNLFGGRDHTTAIWSVNTVQNDIDINEAAKELYETLKFKCLSEAQK